MRQREGDLGGLSHGAEAGPFAVRAGLPEAAHPHQDQAGVVTAERGVIQAPLLQPTGPEGLDHDVNLSRQTTHQVTAFRQPEVNRRRAFPSVQPREAQRQSVLLGRPLAGEVTRPRVFDLDDVSAEIAQHAAGRRRGVHGAQLQDANTVERSRSGHQTRH